MKKNDACQPVAIVTGGSSGIGEATALSLAASGYRVYTFSRRDYAADGVHHVRVDVTDVPAVEAAVAQVTEDAGRVDVLVNAAGFGISGAVEFTDPVDAHQQMDVNYFGAVNVTAAVLGEMRRQKSGKIINITSVAAPAAIPFQAHYSASKAALGAFSLALGNEVRPFGISVSAVQLGDVATGFTDARQKSAAGDDAYGGRITRSVSGMERDERGGMSAHAVGGRIAAIIRHRCPKPLYTIGFGYRCICLLLRMLPASVVRTIVGWLYAR